MRTASRTEIEADSARRIPCARVTLTPRNSGSRADSEVEVLTGETGSLEKYSLLKSSEEYTGLI